MTDREMLKRAAAAAGKDHVFWSNAYKDWIRMHDSAPWRPLTDDGDEARLEAALMLDVAWGRQRVGVGSMTSCLQFERYDDHNGDRQAARRRAGVRAAAEMAKEKL